MGTLPPSGTQISMNYVTHAYYNVYNTAASITGSYNPQIGRPSGINTPLGAVFGGRTTPYSYP
jgi:hypothetical protein